MESNTCSDNDNSLPSQDLQKNEDGNEEIKLPQDIEQPLYKDESSASCEILSAVECDSKTVSSSELHVKEKLDSSHSHHLSASQVDVNSLNPVSTIQNSNNKNSSSISSNTDATLQNVKPVSNNNNEMESLTPPLIDEFYKSKTTTQGSVESSPKSDSETDSLKLDDRSFSSFVEGINTCTSFFQDNKSLTGFSSLSFKNPFSKNNVNSSNLKSEPKNIKKHNQENVSHVLEDFASSTNQLKQNQSEVQQCDISLQHSPPHTLHNVDAITSNISSRQNKGHKRKKHSRSNSSPKRAHTEFDSLTNIKPEDYNSTKIDGSYTPPRHDSGCFTPPSQDSSSHSPIRQEVGLLPEKNISTNIPRRDSGSYTPPRRNSGSLTPPRRNSGDLSSSPRNLKQNYSPPPKEFEFKSQGISNGSNLPSRLETDTFSTGTRKFSCESLDVQKSTDDKLDEIGSFTPPRPFESFQPTKETFFSKGSGLSFSPKRKKSGSRTPPRRNSNGESVSHRRNSRSQDGPFICSRRESATNDSIRSASSPSSHSSRGSEDCHNNFHYDNFNKEKHCEMLDNVSIKCSEQISSNLSASLARDLNESSTDSTSQYSGYGALTSESSNVGASGNEIPTPYDNYSYKDNKGQSQTKSFETYFPLFNKRNDEGFDEPSNINDTAYSPKPPPLPPQPPPPQPPPPPPPSSPPVPASPVLPFISSFSSCNSMSPKRHSSYTPESPSHIPGDQYIDPVSGTHFEKEKF
ncbi:hypothetical protein Avbf_11565 [Armadillidium vulgare]|nr:hypothetical protein Avbf_11565 [Armadillidium vulgare]